MSTSARSYSHRGHDAAIIGLRGEHNHQNWGWLRGQLILIDPMTKWLTQGELFEFESHILSENLKPKD